MVHWRNPPQVRYWTTERLNGWACGHLEMCAFAHAVRRSLGTVHTPSAEVAEWLTTSRFSLWAAEQLRYRSIGQADIRWTGHATTRPCEVSHTSRLSHAQRGEAERFRHSDGGIVERRAIESAQMLGTPVAANRSGGAPTLKPAVVAPCDPGASGGGAISERIAAGGLPSERPHLAVRDSVIWMSVRWSGRVRGGCAQAARSFWAIPAGK